MATLILEFVSTTEHYQALYVLVSDYWKMSILRYLAKVFPNHSDLPATAQSFASSIAQATFFNKKSSSKSPLSAGGKVLPKHNAMMTLAGIYEENLLAQMRREPLPLLGHPDPRGHYASWLPDLHRLQDKAQELADEFVSEDGKPAWLLNEAEYARLFGTFEAESDAFGWWRKRHPKAVTRF